MSIYFSTRKLSKEYKGVYANKEIELDIPEKEIIGFVGENGSGKTTFLRLVTKLIFPTEGTVELKKDEKIGAIVESPAYFKGMSGIDNMIYHAKLCGKTRDDASEILKTVGLDPSDKKKVKDYSLGMRQRLGIAIALLNQPNLLILDEPTNGLDPQGIVDLRAFLEVLVRDRNITLIVSSHILSELEQFATYYIFISHGRIVETLSAKELQEKFCKTIEVESPNQTFNEILDVCKAENIISGYSKNDNKWILKGPFKYNLLFSQLSNVIITSFESKDETLESYYLHIIGGRK